jgi:hypothetical protein
MEHAPLAHYLLEKRYNRLDESLGELLVALTYLKSGYRFSY